MKPQPFNLELWLHLGNPDCVWTRNKEKVYQMHWHEDAKQTGAILSGLVGANKWLGFWKIDGKDILTSHDASFSGNDLMLHLEDKPSTFGIKKK